MVFFFFFFIKLFWIFYFSVLAGEDGGLCIHVCFVCVCVRFFWKGAKRD